MDNVAKVLVVYEYDNVMLNIKKSLSNTRDLAADFVANSDMAISLLTENSYDVIIIEPGISPIDGFSLVRLIRSGVFKNNRNIKVINLINNLSNSIAENTAQIYNVNKVISYSDIDNLSSHISSTLSNIDNIRFKYKVLVIEDTEDTRELYIRFLEQKYDVVAVEDGHKGLEKLQSEYFDIVIIDYMMPGISGIDVIKEIVKKGYAKNIISITARSEIAVAKRLLEAGATDFLIKPVNFNDVHNACERSLKRAEFTLSLSQVESLSSTIEVNESKEKELLSSISHVVVKLNGKLRIDYLSPSWYSHTLFRTEESLGENFIDRYISSENKESLLEECEKMLSGVSSKLSLCININCKKELKNSYLLLNPDYENGKIIGLIGLIIMDSDILVERERLEILASHDHETSLLNSYSFRTMTNKLVNKAANSDHTVIFIYFNGFRQYLKESGLISAEELLMKLGSIVNKQNTKSKDSYRIFGALFARVIPFRKPENNIEMKSILEDELNSYLKINFPQITTKLKMCSLHENSIENLIDDSIKELL